jgi:hypothetical protein
MSVQRLIVTDYSTGKEYVYGDNSGSWESIQAVDGEVNGNYGNGDGPAVTATAVGSASTSDISVPVGGIADDGSSATATQTGWPWVGTDGATAGAIPDGWMINDEGKIVPIGLASGMRPPSLVVLLLSPLLGVWALRQRLL